MKLDDLSGAGCSLLIYLETTVVDHMGMVDSRKINEDDHKIIKQWNTDGFVLFGRMASVSIEQRIRLRHLNSAHEVYWCELSDDAWRITAELRKDRGKRLLNGRTYKRAGED